MISSNACERRTCDVFHRQSLFGEPCYFVAVRSVSACEESASTDFGMHNVWISYYSMHSTASSPQLGVAR